MPDDPQTATFSLPAEDGAGLPDSSQSPPPGSIPAVPLQTAAGVGSLTLAATAIANDQSVSSDVEAPLPPPDGAIPIQSSPVSPNVSNASPPEGAIPLNANPADNGTGLIAIAKDAINRAGIAGEKLLGKYLDPFQQQEEDARSFLQFISGDWSGEKTKDGTTIIPLSPGEMLSRDSRSRPTNPNYDEFRPDPTKADTNAPGVALAVGTGKAAVGGLGFAGGAAVGAPFAPETLGASSLATGTAGAVVTTGLVDSALNRGAAYGVPGFQKIENDLAAQGKIHIPGVGEVSPEQIGQVVAMAPLAANTVRNLSSQAIADAARRGSIYAAAKLSLQGTTALTSGAAASAGTQLAQNGNIDPQKTAIDALLTLPLMMPEGRSLRDNPSMFSSNDRVEDHIDFDTMKRAGTPVSPEGGTSLALVAPEKVRADLESHASALPAASTESDPDVQPLPTEDKMPEQSESDEKSFVPIDVRTSESPEGPILTGPNASLSELTRPDGFTLHDGVAFSPTLVAPSQSPEDDATKLAAAHLSDGLRANGVQGHRIDSVNDPELPAIFIRDDTPSTIFINRAHAMNMAGIDDYTRQIYFDRVADEEAKHLATVQGIQQAYPGQELKSVLVKAFDELTPPQVQRIVTSYGAHIADAWNQAQNGNPSDALKADIALEGARMLLQQREQEPTTEQMIIPERDTSMEPFDVLVQGDDAKAPILSSILNAAQKLDKASRANQTEFRGRYPTITPRIGYRGSSDILQSRRPVHHEITSPEATSQGSSGFIVRQSAPPGSGAPEARPADEGLSFGRDQEQRSGLPGKITEEQGERGANDHEAAFVERINAPDQELGAIPSERLISAQSELPENLQKFVEPHVTGSLKEIDHYSPKQLHELVRIQAEPYAIKGASAAALARGPVHLVTDWDVAMRNPQDAAARKDFFARLNADEVDAQALEALHPERPIVDPSGESRLYFDFDGPESELVTQLVHHVTNKLAEAQLSPEFQPTHSLLELGIHRIDKEAVRKLDTKFGTDNWIIKPFDPEEAAQGSDVHFPESIRRTLREGSPEDVENLAKIPALTMAQRRIRIALETPEQRQGGRVSLPGEKRVHIWTDHEGGVHVIQGATVDKHTNMVHAIDTLDTRDAEHAARQAVEGFPIQERKGSFFGPDMIKDASGNWRIVEANPTIVEGQSDPLTGRQFEATMQSGYLDYPAVQDAVLSALRGELPTHVRIARRQLAQRIGDPLSSGDVNTGEGRWRDQWRPMTDAERAAEDAARNEMMAEAFGDRDTLLDAVQKAGGIPTMDPILQGELDALKEGKNRGTMLRLFRKSAMSLDHLREALSEQGFNYDTPAQMLDAILGSVRTGKSVYGATPPPVSESALITGASKDLLARFATVARAKIGDYMRMAFTPNGSLPREVFDTWHDTEQQKAAILTQGKFLLRDLRDTIQKVHGTRMPNPAVMAREMQVVNDALQGKFQFKPDSPMFLPVKRIRDFIDSLSDELIRSGATDSKLIPHIEAQKGFYLTRSYEAFDNPNWYKKWEKTVGPEVANRAKSIVASWVMDDWLSETDQFNPAKGAFMADKQARFEALQSTAEKLAFVEEQGLPGVFTRNDQAAVHEALLEKAEEWSATPEGQTRIQGEINSLTRRNEDGQLGLFSRGKLGSKNLSILQHRKEIPEAVRQMMGEYKGADINFTRSAAKMAALWQNHQFLKKVRNIGLNKFLFEKKQGGYFVELAADGSKTMSPLNGLYTTPEIASAFHHFNVTENLPDWARLLQLANLYPKLAVTVMNPSSIGHNAISQTSSWILNGHWMAFNPANWRVPIATIAEREGWNGIRGLMGVKQEEARDYLYRLIQLGVVEQGALPGDLAQTLQDTLHKGETLEGLQNISGAVKRGIQHTTKTHEIPNTITKILQFESERARYAKTLPLAAPQQLDVMAAKAVEATTPTYSQVPALIRYTRRIPLAGPFASFASEVYRNYANTYRWAFNEFKNPATRGIAISRVVGILLYSSLFAALAKATATLCNIDSEEEQKFRKFLPEWSKDSQLLWLDNEGNGKVKYLDSSYITHSSLITQPIHALLNGEDPADALKRSLLAMGKPFLDPQMGTQALLESYLNSRRNSAGGLEPVSNAPDESTQQFAERAEHAMSPLVPGAVTSLYRINQAEQGNVTRYGQQRTVADEIVRDLGFNVTTLDLRQALKYQAQSYAENMDAAESRYQMVLTREGKVSASELLQAKAAMEQTRQAAFARMVDLVSTAQNLGLNTLQIDQVLLDARLGRREIASLDSGRYEPYLPGKQLIRRAYANAEEQGKGNGKARVAPTHATLPASAVPAGAVPLSQ